MKKLFLYLLVCTASFLDAGVYILIDAPEGIATIMVNNQEAIRQSLDGYNKEQETRLVFESGKYHPHLSLAFVTQDELSVDEVAKRFDSIVSMLRSIANEHNPIDITSNFQEAMIAFWPGENYVSIVLKLTENPRLQALAYAITSHLEQKYDIKQGLPFSPHITLGRVYGKNNELAGLEKMGVFKFVRSNFVRLLIEHFKLKGHDGSECRFKLLGSY